MFLDSILKAGLLVSLLLLISCQSPPQTKALLLDPPAITNQHFIGQVPFFPQQQYFCGPTTLSEVANFYGVQQSPQAIAPTTFVPGLEGSLQIEMVAATRQLGMLAYAQRGNMSQLLSLVAEDIPVIVLQNNSIAWLPQWHYAVVIGYDLAAQQVIMHTGVTKEHRLNFATFEQTWQRGDYWMLAMIPATLSSEQFEPFIYAKACQDLLDTGQVDTAVVALQSAIKQWPDYWLPYFLLANHYLTEQPALAVQWFKQGYEYGKNQASYLNNYAYALSQLFCYSEASSIADEGLLLAPDDANLLDTQQQIMRRSTQHANQSCLQKQALFP
jgi:tetratricopeptide (TPR) repeat protein